MDKFVAILISCCMTGLAVIVLMFTLSLKEAQVEYDSKVAAIKNAKEVESFIQYPTNEN